MVCTCHEQKVDDGAAVDAVAGVALRGPLHTCAQPGQRVQRVRHRQDALRRAAAAADGAARGRERHTRKRHGGVGAQAGGRARRAAPALRAAAPRRPGAVAPLRRDRHAARRGLFRRQAARGEPPWLLDFRRVVAPRRRQRLAPGARRASAVGARRLCVARRRLAADSAEPREAGLRRAGFRPHRPGGAQHAAGAGQPGGRRQCERGHGALRLLVRARAPATAGGAARRQRRVPLALGPDGAR